MTLNQRLAAQGTALVSDAAFRSDVPFAVGPPGLTTLDPAWSMAGPAVTVQANDDLPAILHALHRTATGSVLVIASRPSRSAVIGDLIATEGVRRGIGGIVVDGNVRDRSALLDIGLPIAALGTHPVGPLKVPDSGVGVVGATVLIGEARVAPGDWVVADSDGLLVMTADAVAAVADAADGSLGGERRLLDGMADDVALGDLLGIEAFMQERAENPAADFNDHLRRRGGAI